MQLNTAALSSDADFAARVIAWQQVHGRHDLPWQKTQDPYRVWLSEIMLQQTQVATVLVYYQRFLARFPTVADLAQARQDDVMALWAGLGYYSRARNLHRSAQMVMADFGGEFPQTAAQLCQLPGVGMSTAAAIAAFCFGERAAIFDANVQRVLARSLGYAQDLARSQNKNELWARASTLLPQNDCASTMPRYTQGLMDLGATVCTARAPQCARCPLSDDCVARLSKQQTLLPVRSKTLTRKSVDVYLHRLQRGDEIALIKRPPRGIWGGLYCLPEIDAATYAALAAQATNSTLPSFKHVLTHRDLHIHVVQEKCAQVNRALVDLVWRTPAQALSLGLPQPITKLLQRSEKLSK